MDKIELNRLESKLISLTTELNSLSGKCALLNEQISASETKLKKLAHKKEIYQKSVELLTLVQKATKEKIKKGFEQIVTYALRYIYNDDYAFELEFGRRGNLQEIDFNVKAPDFKESFDPKDTSGGGVLDILSLALRIALLELAKPKIEGFIVLDEPFKHLSKNYLQRAGTFLKVINERINRQIIMVTHKSELLLDADNIIEIHNDRKN